MSFLVGGCRVSHKECETSSKNICSIFQLPTTKHIRNIRSGLGLNAAVAGVQSTFTIQATDSFGNFQNRSGDLFAVSAIRKPVTTDSTRFTGTVVYIGDGKYRVTYSPIATGEYALWVTFSSAGAHIDHGAYKVYQSTLGHHINGSPFSLTVADGAAVAASCTAFGSGLVSTTVAKATTFTIQAKDINGNNRTVAGDNFKVEILSDLNIVHVAPNGHTVSTQYRTSTTLSSLGSSTGQYQVKYIPPYSGLHHMSITLGDRHIGGSPFPLVIAPAVANGPTSTAEGKSVLLGNCCGR